jgi:GH24 family phage-related lysozyme (muramidase)
VSDTSKPTKISREGVILIKSFEGFRPRALQRADGRWTIGYGHTRSAREGLTVSESDAELLLQYDLIPVAQTVNAIQAPLNQHQFDALASFAFSVGVDRFKTSDVLARLNAGAPLEAADALMSWVEDADVVTPPRRRAAERALFVADPEAPASLADLLAAPLPPPTATLVETTVDPEPTPDDEEAEAVEPAPFPAFPPSVAVVETPAEAPAAMTREAAVSALLGEIEEADPVEANTDGPDAEAPHAFESAPAPSEPEIEGLVEAATPDVAPETPAQSDPLESIQSAEAADEPSLPTPPLPSSAKPSTPVMTSAATFYSPYAVRALGPLAGFGLRAAPRPSPTPAPAPTIAANDTPPADAVSETSAISTEDAATDLPSTEIQAEALPGQTAEPTLVSISTGDEEQTEVAAEDESDEPVQAIETTAPVAPPEPAPAVEPVEQPVEVPTFAAPLQTPSLTPDVMPLALTGAPNAQPASLETRLVWPEHHDFTHPDQTPLFEQEPAIEPQEPLAEPSARPIAPSFKFEWTETLTFLAMGVIGLLSFGAAMAAFRQSSQSNGDTGLIGWVLVVIALACVAVSGFNLYQRWGRVDRA